MATVWNVVGHYIFVLWFLLSSTFFSRSPILIRQPSQIGCLPYFRTWCGLSANLGCRSETCCTRLAENTGRKKIAKSFAICAPSHNFVGLYLRNKGTYWQSAKNLLSSSVSPMSSQYGELHATSSWDLLASLGHPSKFQQVPVLAALLHGTLVVGVSQSLWR